MTTFAIQVAKWAEKTEADLNTVVQVAVLDIAKRVLERSPVGNPDLWKTPPPKGYVGGHFRANWQYSTTQAPNGILDVIDNSDKGSATLGKIKASIVPDAMGKIHYITNNLPYAQRLEDGWSTQASPSGIVALTITEWGTIIDDAINGVRNGTSKEDFAQGFSTYGL